MSEDGSLKLPSEQPTDDQLVSMSEDREDGILMPHEYTFRRAALDTIKQNPIFTIILLVIGIAQVALSAFSDPGDIIGASDLMMMGAFWATVYGVILGYAGLRTMSEERERREVALMERAVALDDGPDKENTLPFEFLPFTTRVRLSVTPVLRKNRVPIGAGVAIILATSAFMAVAGSPQDGFGCVLAGLLIYALAAGPLLLKEMRQFTYGRGFAGSIHADHQNDKRTLVGWNLQMGCTRFEYGQQLGSQGFTQAFGIITQTMGPFAQTAQDTFSGFNANIGE